MIVNRWTLTISLLLIPFFPITRLSCRISFKSSPTTSQSNISKPSLLEKNVRIERIVSNENTTPEGEWYDQSQREWVIVLEGSGSIEIEEGRSVTLNKGDHLLIEKQERHRVTHTDPNTIWLAVHFD